MRLHEDDLETSVVDWAIDHPESVAIFEEHGIDYCCGGKSLRSACLNSGVDPSHILMLIQRATER